MKVSNLFLETAKVASSDIVHIEQKGYLGASQFMLQTGMHVTG